MAMPAQMEREDLAGARVLVVEDEFVIALEVEVLLRDFGCEVLGPVPSVVRALELLGRERPDAAPLDLDLLDGMAVPVAELLASMGVPFALVTAYDPTPVEAPALRGVPHLGKPVGHDTLRRMLAALLDVPRAAHWRHTRRKPGSQGLARFCPRRLGRPPVGHYP